ncbi:mitochondrial carrier homolog 2 [Toxorhynchites rutilus septentrionalis]|uniref:mitochondrial carrier homolog 2 n=1 Tax=Toxorhynchites rutilus septentrionalis TaxID=329112 RepID=UPI0024785A81|nr:mitochondrial carrier homolog 2 [Toxorhynchites rutilus septentrionalis]
MPTMLEIDGNGNEHEANQWIRFGLRLGVTTALHPFDYAKVLMQIGFEPIDPRPGRTLLGKPTLILPNVFQYAAYIKRVDGFAGCFRGLSAKIIGNIFSAHYSEKIADELGLEEVHDTDVKRKTNDEQVDNTQLDEQFKKQLKRNLVVHTAGVVISQPFHVISIRMMAQFVGREKLYSGVWQSIREIWSEEGIFGFFAGFVPRLLCDLGCLIVSSSVTYLASRYIIKEHEGRVYFSSISQFVASSMFYPYHVVSTCMIVNGSRLKAGSLPNMEPYRDWRDCYAKLRKAGEHKRGSSLFFRYASQPASVVFNRAIAPYPELKK